MNLFHPEKKLNKVYFRYGESEFVLLTIFVFSASKQNWKVEEIKKVVQEAKKKDYEHLFITLKNHSNAYKFE